MLLIDSEMFRASKQRFTLPKEIAEEHAAIQTILRWMEAEFERSGASAGGPGASSFLHALETFGEHLQRHFAFEERSGFQRAAILALPDGQALYLEWRQEHLDFLARLSACLDLLRSATRTGAAPGDAFAALLRNLFQDLREHQAFEGRLLGDQGSLPRSLGR